MKMKKLLALILSSLMALTVLTACGGGSHGNELDLGELNAMISNAGGDFTVRADRGLNAGVLAAAAEIEKGNIVGGEVIQQHLDGVWKLSTWVVEDRDLDDPGLTLTDIPDAETYEQIKSLGELDTPEKAAAAAALKLHAEFSDRIICASIQSAEMPTGRAYWVIAVVALQ